MEPANKPPVKSPRGRPARSEQPAYEFLPDADEIERQPLPRVATLTIHLLGLALLVFIVVASLAQVDIIVSARGQLTTPLPNIVMQPLDTSIVSKINVRAGQVVRKGDELATLDSTFTEADEVQLRIRLESLDRQQKFLEAELSGKPLTGQTGSSNDSLIQNRLSSERLASYQAQIQRLDENIGRLRATLETNRRDQASMTSRVQVLREMTSMQEQLSTEKLVPRTKVLEARDRLLEAERGAEMARSRAQEIQKELMGLEAERQTFKTGWRQKVMEDQLALSRERDSINEQLQKADKRNQMVVMTAPADAVILEVAKLSPGSIARATEPFLTLVPLGDTLEAEVKIDATDIGYVKLGDKVHVKVDTYPYQLHGALEGELSTVSQDSFRRDSNNTHAPEAYYLSRVHLTRTELTHLPEHARLIPGMTVVAEITVGKRSVMSYILWPLMKALNESIREP